MGRLKIYRHDINHHFDLSPAASSLNSPIWYCDSVKPGPESSLTSLNLPYSKSTVNPVVSFCLSHLSVRTVLHGDDKIHFPPSICFECSLITQSKHVWQSHQWIIQYQTLSRQNASLLFWPRTQLLIKTLEMQPSTVLLWCVCVCVCVCVWLCIMFYRLKVYFSSDLTHNRLSERIPRQPRSYNQPFPISRQFSGLLRSALKTYSASQQMTKAIISPPVLPPTILPSTPKATHTSTHTEDFHAKIALQ